MPFQIVLGDITKVKADAIVNTANRNPVIGGGTDGAVYAAAGAEELLSEGMKIGEIAPGERLPCGRRPDAPGNDGPGAAAGNDG